MPPLVALILYIAVVGFLIWALTTYIPMPYALRVLIYIVGIVVVCVWLFQVIGGNAPSLRFGG